LAEIVVFCDAELFAGTRSAVAAPTVAVFVVLPGRQVAVTETVMTHVARLTNVGRVHVTTLPANLRRRPVMWPPSR
jgi:hypothetical protein